MWGRGYHNAGAPQGVPAVSAGSYVNRAPG